LAVPLDTDVEDSYVDCNENDLEATVEKVPVISEDIIIGVIEDDDNPSPDLRGVSAISNEGGSTKDLGAEFKDTPLTVREDEEDDGYATPEDKGLDSDDDAIIIPSVTVIPEHTPSWDNDYYDNSEEDDQESGSESFSLIDDDSADELAVPP
jgi:hypothetical protein